MPGYSDPATPGPACWRGADPATGARADAAAYEHVLRVRIQRPCRRAVQLGGGHVYSRIQQPDQRGAGSASLTPGGRPARSSTASGRAALHRQLAALAGASGHIVASTALYGGSTQPAAATRCAASASGPPSWQTGRHRRLARRDPPERELLFGETLGNRGWTCWTSPPSAIAHEARLPLLVDSTFTAPG